MGLKAVYGGFTNPEPGIHIARIKKVEWADHKDKDQNVIGRQARLEYIVEGGGSDGMQQSDWFYTVTKGDFSLNKLFGVCVKAGLFKDTDDIGADTFKGEKNEAGLKAKLEERMIGLDIRADKKDKERIRVFQYLTVKEAQALLKGNGKAQDKPESTSKQSSAWD
jgi:hypothetical protein